MAAMPVGQMFRVTGVEVEDAMNLTELERLGIRVIDATSGKPVFDTLGNYTFTNVPTAAQVQASRDAKAKVWKKLPKHFLNNLKKKINEKLGKGCVEALEYIGDTVRLFQFTRLA